MSYTAIQYTPVDCIATVRIPHYLSQLAIAFSSAVVQPKCRTGWLSRAAGRHVVGVVADINAGGIRMSHFQADMFALDLPRRRPPLLAVHLLPMALRRLVGCVLGFLLLL